MNNAEIIEVTINDIEALQSIGERTFYETFAAYNSEENMRKYLEEEFAIDKLKAEIYDKNVEFYFARYNNEVIGYLKLNSGSSQNELKDENSVEIERIYVLKDYHGKDVGQKLYEKALDIARLKNAEFVWLGVWEQNPRAINFYKKNGFVAFDKHLFILGDEEQIDIMMKLQLND